MSATVPDTHLCADLAAWMRRALGFKAADQAAYFTETSRRTTERWIRGTTAPNALQLLRLARHPGFRAELRRYLDNIEMEEANIASRMEELAAQRVRSSDRVVGSSGASQRQTTACSSSQGLGNSGWKRS